MDKNKPLFKVVIFLMVIVVMGIFAKSYFGYDSDYSTDTNSVYTPSAPVTDKLNCVVDISGEVNNPGVYNIESGAIVDEAISAAGGYTANADKEAINRAERVYDGMKIVVPKADDDTYMDIYKEILGSDMYDN